jgi:hypothetical protein
VKRSSPYIVGRTFDWIFFLASPVWALCIGILVSRTTLATDNLELNGEYDTAVGFFTGIVVHAHLVAVVFRSHANPSIRKLYPVRFFVVPVVLYVAIVASHWVAAASIVVATFWDVWHSGAQTFGFARIYERNHGTSPEVGRRLDFVLNQVLYAGPILAGATLMDHFDSFDNLWTSVPAAVEGHARYLTYGVLVVGTVIVVAYVIAYSQLARRGAWSPPWLKIWLTASTAVVSIYTWAFNSWGQAFLIMNLFHAVQYLALVWAMEGKRIAGLFGLAAVPRLALLLYLVLTVMYGVGVVALNADVTTLWAITMVVSLMHFWYDAFVWSVRRKQI